MVINKADLIQVQPVSPFCLKKCVHSSGTSFGLGEAGYDIRLKQMILFSKDKVYIDDQELDGHFCIASSIERFKMPDNLVAIVHDKSTWARQGLSVFNTVLEPGWEGYLTLELVYHGKKDLFIPSGSGIAQVIFHQLSNPANYAGKYQNQPDRPVDSIWQKEGNDGQSNGIEESLS